MQGLGEAWRQRSLGTAGAGGAGAGKGERDEARETAHAASRELRTYMLDVLFRAPARLFRASSRVLREVATFMRMWWSLPLP